MRGSWRTSARWRSTRFDHFTRARWTSSRSCISTTPPRTTTDDLSSYATSTHCYTRLWRPFTSLVCLTSGVMRCHCWHLLNAAPASAKDRPKQATRHPGVQSYTDASSRLTQTAIAVLRERMRQNRERGETRRGVHWHRVAVTESSPAGGYCNRSKSRYIRK